MLQSIVLYFSDLTPRRHPTTITLLVANVAPIAGVLFFGWDLFMVMFLYWAESAVIGFYNLFRLAKIAGSVLSIFILPFFLLHYGIFMLVHLSFLYAFFGPGYIGYGAFLPTIKEMGSFSLAVAIPIFLLFISHGYSYFANFIGKREYRHLPLETQMSAPYVRIVVMHLTIIFGGWLVLGFGEPLLGLIFLMILKTIVDYLSHIREHKKLQERIEEAEGFKDEKKTKNNNKKKDSKEEESTKQEDAGAEENDSTEEDKDGEDSNKEEANPNE